MTVIRFLKPARWAADGQDYSGGRFMLGIGIGVLSATILRLLSIRFLCRQHLFAINPRQQ